MRSRRSGMNDDGHVGLAGADGVGGEKSYRESACDARSSRYLSGGWETTYAQRQSEGGVISRPIRGRRLECNRFPLVDLDRRGRAYHGKNQRIGWIDVITNLPSVLRLEPSAAMLFERRPKRENRFFRPLGDFLYGKGARSLVASTTVADIEHGLITRIAATE